MKQTQNIDLLIITFMYILYKSLYFRNIIGTILKHVECFVYRYLIIAVAGIPVGYATGRDQSTVILSQWLE